MEVLDWKEFLYPYEQAVNELTVKFESLLNEYHTLGLYAPFESVTGRVKSVSSILDKALRKNIPLDRGWRTLPGSAFFVPFRRIFIRCVPSSSSETISI